MIVREVPTDEIKDQTLQRPVNSHMIHELAASIKKHGIVQPLVVATDESGIHLIAGQRRLMAARMLNLATVPCNVLDADHEAALSISLHENLQREQLSPFDEAQTYKYLTTKLQYSGRDIARMIGKSEPYVSQRLQITTWPADLQEALRAGQLEFSVCREIASIKDLRHMRACIKSALDFGVNYRTARAWRINFEKDQARVPTPGPPSVEPGPPSPPVPILTDCFYCEHHFPMSETVSVTLCNRCFGVLQDAIVETKRSGK